MNSAIDPVSGKLYEVEVWLKNCGNRREGICQVCGDNVYLRADKSEDRRTHFAHKKGSPCPTIVENHRPFEQLNASDTDLENAKIVKLLINSYSYLLYEKCKRMSESLTVKEFRELIEFANTKGVWNYKGLTFTYVPYILLTCREKFSKKDSEFRKRDFYFVFDPNVKNVDELWNDTKRKKQKLWKIYLSNDNSIVEYLIDDSLEPEWFAFTKEFISKKLT
ncbi:hypothetical protein JOD82_004861 [Paenibacillus sp. 1182]|nr:hypothetical protein [Paenibacillus sp. 1182]MBP1311724.1 hypothetical protein [Paenibacillus sp. 1182]